MLVVDHVQPRVYSLPNVRPQQRAEVETVLNFSTRTTPRCSSQQDALAVVVFAGPDTGMTFGLPRGESMIGRGDGRVTLTDSNVSRRHAILTVQSDGVYVQTAAGTVAVNGRNVIRHRVTDADTIQIGKSTLVLVAGQQRCANPGTISRTVSIDVPAPPKPPWVAVISALAPIGIGVALWFLLHSWFMLLFGLVGVVTGGVITTQDLSARRKHRRYVRQVVAQYCVRLNHELPNPGALIASWRTGHPDQAPDPRAYDISEPLALRVGHAHGSDMAVSGGGYGQQKRYRRAHSRPSGVFLHPGDVVVVHGTEDAAAAVLRALLLSFVHRGLANGWTLRVPDSSLLPARVLGLRGVTVGADVASEEVQLVPPERPHGDALAPVRIRHSHDDPHISTAGASNKWVVDVNAQTVSSGIHRESVEIDRLSFRALDQAATLFTQRTSKQVGALTQDENGPTHSYPGPESLTARLGSIEERDLHVDLVTDGPHALVAGTTGSGKSELLRVWALGLAEAYGPDRLRMVLVDFKGGSTFGDLMDLAQVESLVTDLEGDETDRVLDVVARELKSREALLAQHGSPDLLGLGSLAPPRIVVMVDEFRILAEERPAVLSTLMRLATVGRSLGLHLILATQRPQGVISPEIRANLSLTLCLRLLDASESVDLIGHPGASTLNPSQPGKVYIRRGGEHPLLAQVDPVSETPGEVTCQVFGPKIRDVTHTRIVLPPAPTLAERVQVIASATPEQEEAPSLKRLIPPGLPAALSPYDLPPSSGDELTLGVMTQASGATGPLQIPRSSSLGLIGSGGLADAGSIRGLARVLSGPTALNTVVLDSLGVLSTTRHMWGGYAGPSEMELATEMLYEIKNGRMPLASSGPREPPKDVPRPVLWVISPHGWWGDVSDTAALEREQWVRDIAVKGQTTLIVTGGRDLATSRLATTLTRRIYLPFSVSAEAKQMWPPLLTVSAHEGRGVLCGPGLPERGVAAHLPTAEAVPLGPQHGHLWGAPRTGARLTRRSRRSAAPTLPLCLSPTHESDGLKASPAGLVLGTDRAERNAVIEAWCHGRPTWWATEPSSPAPESEQTARHAEVWAVEDFEALSARLIDACASRIAAGRPVIVGAVSNTRLPYAMPWWQSANMAESSIVLSARTAADVEPLGWKFRAADIDQPGVGLVSRDGRSYRAVVPGVAHRLLNAERRPQIDTAALPGKTP